MVTTVRFRLTQNPTLSGQSNAADSGVPRRVARWQPGVSDQRLLDQLHGLLGGAAQVEARLIAHLAEVEERRLHLKAACSSMFDYCLRRLH